MPEPHVFFSIITPSYNRAHLLPRAIKSVLTQTYPHWELLIVDDGSTDNTQEVVQKYAEQDERIRYIYQENAERCAARNNGIAHAKGQYVCFLDSDDAYEAGYLQALYDYVGNYPGEQNIFYCNLEVKQEDGRTVLLENTAINYPNQPTWLFADSIIPTRVSGPIMAFKEHSFNTHISISEDTELWVRLSLAGYLFVHLPYAGAIYYKHDDNSVNTARYNAYKARRKTLQSILSYPSSSKIDSEIAREVVNNCFFGIYRYWFGRSRLRAAGIMLHALAAFPSHRMREKLYLLYAAFFKKGLS